MESLRDAKLLDAAVPRTATFEQAARVLCEHGVAAVAVLDEERCVVGLVTDDDVVGGLFPRYLKELHHTAFTEDVADVLAERARQASAEMVERHMRAAVTVEIDTSATHAAERFLHVPWGALAVVERGRFVGILSQIDFLRWMLDRLGARAAGRR